MARANVGEWVEVSWSDGPNSRGIVLSVSGPAIEVFIVGLTGRKTPTVRSIDKSQIVRSLGQVKAP